MGGDLSEEEHFQLSFSLGPSDVELFRSEFAWRRWDPGRLIVLMFVLLANAATYWFALWALPKLGDWPYFEAVAALPTLVFFSGTPVEPPLLFVALLTWLVPARLEFAQPPKVSSCTCRSVLDSSDGVK